MSTPVHHIHPLIARLREEAEASDLTREQIAAEIGVSLRTLVYWMNEDVTPQKRYRPMIAEWLDRVAA